VSGSARASAYLYTTEQVLQERQWGEERGREEGGREGRREEGGQEDRERAEERF
jgi:hypothetical protein